MKYIFRLCSRPHENVSIEEKHSKLVEGLVRLGRSWGLPPAAYAAPVFGEEVSARFPLGKSLGKGIKGFVNYRFRGGLRDESDHDDYIDLEFNPHRIDFAELLNRVFPAYIECFEPYLAYVCDEEFTYIDFDRSRGFNHRNGVLRIHPANYFDQTLCARAFGMSADDVVDRLNCTVEHSEVINGGVLLVVRGMPMSIEDGENIDGKLRALLETHERGSDADESE